MKIGDLAIKKLKKFIEVKGLSGKGNKKELCQTILNSLEEQVIKQIEQCWNNDLGSKELPQDPMDVNDELGKELQNFINLHDKEKIKILESYEELQNKKQKLKERINEQQQNFLKLPKILRFNAGQEISISKSFFEKYPNSLLYTLISSSIWFEKFENQNKYYLNCGENTMLKILDFVRMLDTSDPQLDETWGFSSIEYSNTICLDLDNKLLEQDQDIKNDYQKFKQIIENEIKYQTDLLIANSENYETQLDTLKELVYNDPIILNVGGKLFTISTSKLNQHENTYFPPLISGKWELENNTHFIDRSYHHFHIIHDYLVSAELSTNLTEYFNSLNKTFQNIFLKELDYYQLNKILEYLPCGFSESKILNKEELEYVQTHYPAAWRLIPPIEEITETIDKTTIIIKYIANHSALTAIGKYILFTENSIDLTIREPYLFEWLSIEKRGTPHRWDYPNRTLRDALVNNPMKYEIYENISD